MSRTPRQLSEHNVYHVFARGVGRLQILEDDEDNAFFLGLLRRFSLSDGCDMLAYCLMGNHFHLLVIAVGDAPALPGREGKGVVLYVVSDQCMALPGHGVVIRQRHIHGRSSAYEVASGHQLVVRAAVRSGDAHQKADGGIYAQLLFDYPNRLAAIRVRCSARCGGCCRCA